MQKDGQETKESLKSKTADANANKSTALLKFNKYRETTSSFAVV